MPRPSASLRASSERIKSEALAGEDASRLTLRFRRLHVFFVPVEVDAGADDEESALLLLLLLSVAFVGVNDADEVVVDGEEEESSVLSLLSSLLGVPPDFVMLSIQLSNCGVKG